MPYFSGCLYLSPIISLLRCVLSLSISSSAIYHLDTSDNHILINNQIYHESSYPYQILGQIYLNYIHRPLVMNKNYYIEKIKKNIFAADLKSSLIKQILMQYIIIYI